MIQSVCPQKYIQNQKNAGWRLNAIPIINSDDFINTGFQFYNLYFPRPWVLVGLVTLDDIPPATTPTYPRSYSNFRTPTIHNTNADLFQSIFLDLAFATTHNPDQNTYVCNYMGPGTQAVNYLGKFSPFLNDSINSVPEEFYNSIIQPESILKTFCADNAASANDLWRQRWYELIAFLQSTIDQERMGAPGLYSICKSAAQFSAYNDWNGQTSYENFPNL